jgi:putative flippase GtrA
MHHVRAAVLGAVLGGIIDFAVKKFWVFNTAHQRTIAEGWRYALVSGTSAVVFGGVVFVLVDVLHRTLPMAVVAASCLVGLFWNYPMHRWFVFPAASPTRRAA